MIITHTKIEFIEVEELPTTKRGKGELGSAGS
jgi:dUTPase